MGARVDLAVDFPGLPICLLKDYFSKGRKAEFRSQESEFRILGCGSRAEFLQAGEGGEELWFLFELSERGELLFDVAPFESLVIA